jgi:hypothetical protein
MNDIYNQFSHYEYARRISQKSPCPPTLPIQILRLETPAETADLVVVADEDPIDLTGNLNTKKCLNLRKIMRIKASFGAKYHNQMGSHFRFQCSLEDSADSNTNFRGRGGRGRGGRGRGGNTMQLLLKMLRIPKETLQTHHQAQPTP